MDTNEKTLKPFEMGRVNLIFNGHYSVLDKFDPSKTNIQQITPYNDQTVQIRNIMNFFGDSKHLHLKAYFGITRNTYLVSKLISNGPIILVYNPHIMNTIETSIKLIESTLEIFKKNNPNCPVGIVIRDQHFIENEFEKNEISQKFKNILGENFIDLQLCGFSYARDSYVNEKFYEITIKMIKDYYKSHPEEFIKFEDDKEILYTRRLFMITKKENDVTVFTKHFLSEMANQPNDLQILLDKLIKAGFLFHINTKNLNNLYFINNTFTCSVPNILLRIFEMYGAGYKRKKINYPSNAHEHAVISTSNLVSSIPYNFSKQVKNAIRFMLIIMKELKIGRILGDKYIYIRRYKYDTFNRHHNKGIDFIYN